MNAAPTAGGPAGVPGAALSSASIARVLEFSTATVEQMRRRGELPTHRIGAYLITLDAELQAWLDGIPAPDPLLELPDPATADDVASYLGVPVSAVRGWMKDTLLRATPAGIARAEVASMLRGSLVTVAASTDTGAADWYRDPSGRRPGLLRPPQPAASFDVGTVLRTEAGRYWRVQQRPKGQARWVPLTTASPAAVAAQRRLAVRDSIVVAVLALLLLALGAGGVIDRISILLTLLAAAICGGFIAARWGVWRRHHVVVEGHDGD